MWYVYTVEYYSAIKKNEIMSFAAAWMNLEITLTEVSHTKDRTETDTEDKTYGYQRGKGRRMR